MFLQSIFVSPVFAVSMLSGAVAAVHLVDARPEHFTPRHACVVRRRHAPRLPQRAAFRVSARGSVADTISR
ncbi:hypothetical protein C6T68_26185 [Burkholderia multivorans]|nr:hypothetical protein C6T68_26185 [Burkholderia multivorans]